MNLNRFSGDYAELLCRSNFSFLRGASDAREYIRRAAELQIKAIGIVDRNGVYALPRAFEECREYPEIKLISGAEITFLDHPNLNLIARDRAAWGVLCRIITAAHAGKEKGEANLTRPELIEFMERPEARGLICLPEPKAETDFSLLKDLFEDRLYLPLSRYLDGADQKRERFAKKIAKQYDLKIVATNQPHYHASERSELQDCLVCIREGIPYREAGDELFANAERYLKSPLTMRSLFKEMPEALWHTLEIAESCEFKLSDLSYTYPKELTPDGESSQSYLETLVMEGAHKIYRGVIPAKVDAQIQHEFHVIRDCGYAPYFLTIQDIVRFAKSKGIFCQGRGSAANSIVCFLLEITAVDPIKCGLLFERFISKERAEPPDIDIDFDNSRREEVIQYIYEKYGRDRAGMVAAVRTYREKSAFLEISKALGVDVGTVSASELERNFAEHAGSDVDKLPKIQALMELIEDFPRHLSIHSGGFTLSHTPLIEIVPIEPARMPGRTIIQWDKSDIDTVNLCKIDCLSLGFFNAMGQLEKTTGVLCREIPVDDEETFESIRAADTDGVFQIESRAQKVMLVRTLPETHYDLVVEISLVRPGPGQGNMVHPYIAGRAAARRGVHYHHDNPHMKRILGRTHGVPIFQEQVMQLAIHLADFTPGQADQLRRCLSAFRSKEGVDTVTRKLYDGMIKKGISKADCDQQFEYMKGYAHYGFPESHAASFALITYWSAYYKRHYPAHLFCALVNSQPMGFYSVDYLLQSFKRFDVHVLPIDPHRSNWDAQLLDDQTVLMGFRDLRGVREDQIETLVAARSKQPFRSLMDFVQRSGLDKRVLRSMALANLFECFGHDSRSSFWNSIEHEKLFDQGSTLQLALFSDLDFGGDKTPNHSFRSMSLLEKILYEHQATGYSVIGNIMHGVRENFRHFAPAHSQVKWIIEKMNSQVFLTLNFGWNTSVAGVVVVIQKPPTAKGVCFITLEDEFGTVDTVIPPLVYEKFRTLIRQERLLILSGQVKPNGTNRLLIVNGIQIIPHMEEVHTRSSAPGDHPRNMGAFRME